MKTHTARWFQNSDTTWVLKEKASSGGAVLATIRAASGRGCWYQVGDGNLNWAPSKYAAQRAVRRALSK